MQRSLAKWFYSLVSTTLFAVVIWIWFGFANFGIINDVTQQRYSTSYGLCQPVLWDLGTLFDFKVETHFWFYNWFAVLLLFVTIYLEYYALTSSGIFDKDTVQLGILKTFLLYTV